MYKKEGYDIPMGETLERLRENSWNYGKMEHYNNIFV
jgi:hypothetical protein